MINTKNDLELTPGPTDGAPSLSFSPVADYLAASSWDGQVREIFFIFGLFTNIFINFQLNTFNSY